MVTININGVVLYLFIFYCLFLFVWYFCLALTRSRHAQFIENIISDGRVGKVESSLGSNNNIVFTVPSFWEKISMQYIITMICELIINCNIAIDPVYSVLLDHSSVDDCNSAVDDDGVCIFLSFSFLLLLY